jgi:hypothetical protein
MIGAHVLLVGGKPAQDLQFLVCERSLKARNIGYPIRVVRVREKWRTFDKRNVQLDSS